jgi:hypothetical protein
MITTMGAACIVRGTWPQIAQTVVQDGVYLEGVTNTAAITAAFRGAHECSAASIASSMVRS